MGKSPKYEWGPGGKIRIEGIEEIRRGNKKLRFMMITFMPDMMVRGY